MAVVTGASSGMGAATARRLAELGAAVAVVACRQEKLEALADDIASRGRQVLSLPVDVTDRAAVRTAADQVADTLGPADLVFNNAGVQLISAIDELRVDDWQRQIDLNVKGVMNVIAAFLPHLTAAADRGAAADLINASSIAATRILEKYSIYSGTKAYIRHLTRLIRVELGRKNVRVSAIEPGMVDTELPDHVTDPAAGATMAGLLHDIECLRDTDGP
ncbi:putative oxidoreductase [Streptomyces sp. RB17]|uniref:SDR family oxidoreductase n=1 Tax=Streptomyces sp. RB17 TaxID=2585197 RepID=UPI00130B2E92|nr:SDR family oxidoreductase [Streptomyces sp. RB17]MQY40873.1 putative oxidoreductase [Streptomyces sp. RB17]